MSEAQELFKSSLHDDQVQDLNFGATGLGLPGDHEKLHYLLWLDVRFQRLTDWLPKHQLMKFAQVLAVKLKFKDLVMADFMAWAEEVGRSELVIDLILKPVVEVLGSSFRGAEEVMREKDATERVQELRQLLEEMMEFSRSDFTSDMV